MIARSMLSSDNPNWQTPETVLERVRIMGPIRLDPATVTSNPTRADYINTPGRDGLVVPWTLGAGGLIYLNPPYGRTIAKWCEKAIMEWSAVSPLIPGT
jgi:hypothetical protein